MKLLHIIAILLAVPFLTHGAQPAETREQYESRMRWFNEARFGMFIHWGVCASAAGMWNGRPVAGDSEYIQFNARVSAEEYRSTLLSQFNPTKYDPESWVLAAKNAGMKYIVITAKHHDGFCLWDSALTDWSVASTPYRKDLLTPLAEACRKHGIKFCIFYSIMDWSHPDYGTKATWRGNAKNRNPDMDRYVEYLKGQLKELLTSYGDVGLLWFDGEWESSWTHERAVDLYDYLRSLQPSLIINNRIDKGRADLSGRTTDSKFKGDYGTPEQQIPAAGFPNGEAWESCMTMNDSWGYKPNDHNWKSPEVLVRNLIETASKGGNYLLDVGPTADGEIPKESLDCLAAIGDWMKVNGESIYGTTGSLFKGYSWDGRSTTRRMDDGTTRLYLHLYQLPEAGTLMVRCLTSKPVKAALLGYPKTLAISGKPGAWRIQLPKTSLTPFAAVIALTIEGEPVFEEMTYEPDDSGAVALDVYGAKLHGNGIRIDTKAGLSNIGYWMNADDFVSWRVRVPAGKYRIIIDGACGTNGSELSLQLGDQEVRSSFPGTGGWYSYRVVDAGVVNATNDAGEFTIRATSGTGIGFVNIRSVTLQPVRE
jgi:alpha-L-fucosidase